MIHRLMITTLYDNCILFKVMRKRPNKSFQPHINDVFPMTSTLPHCFRCVVMPCLSISELIYQSMICEHPIFYCYFKCCLYCVKTNLYFTFIDFRFAMVGMKNDPKNSYNGWSLHFHFNTASALER